MATKKLKRSEPVPDGVRRLALQRLERALEVLASGDPDAIHEVRKELKQVRALLRLVRSELGSKRFAAENARYRDIARPLSAIRDSQALVQAAQKLAGTQSPLVKALKVRHRAVQHQLLVDEHQLERSTRALEQGMRTVSRWKLEHRGWKALGPNLERVMSRCRRAMAQAKHSGEDDALHSWRKQAKYLRAVLGVGAPAWPKVVRELDHGLHRLADALGDDHDLAVLEGLIDRGELQLGSTLATHSRATIHARRRKLQAESFKLGEKLFAREPTELVQAMHAGWKAWRS